MRRIHSTGTKPEMLVRKLIHSLGYRYRLHSKQLPGKPDLVFSKRRKAIFVHGCFWHQHPGCKTCHIPKSRQEYWAPKLSRNVNRDRENQRKLREMGWNILVIWECQLKNRQNLIGQIKAFLEDTKNS
ncbi:MAG: very short patch repair endonuclease [Armatimonadota bacterium]|nr:very short patch repair endonuclease [Armatimonadota bacterium]